MINTLRILLLSGVLMQGAYAAAGFRINGSKLLDANGNEFIMRGVNFPYTWYVNNWVVSVPAMAAAGANTVRVVLSTGDQWTRTSGSEISSIIASLKQNKMIAVLEVHDCTGYGDVGDAPKAVALTKAVDYWKSIDVKSALVGQEAYVIINIANEPIGNTKNSEYVASTKSAIQALRNEGFEHTLMVDAANWGQDWSFTGRDNAASILAADPKGNTIYSVHMYDVFDTDAKVQNYLDAFKNSGLPIVVGEFAADHFGKTVAVQKILSQAQANGQGYLGWSWMGNSSGLTSLDIVTAWNGSSLTPWGNILINGANGLKATSKVASVFNGIQSSSLQVSSSSLKQSSSSEVSVPLMGGQTGPEGSIWQELNQICFQPNTEGAVRWSLFDLLGNQVSSGVSAHATEGVHRIELKFNDPGVYVLRLTDSRIQKSLHITLGK